MRKRSSADTELKQEKRKLAAVMDTEKSGGIAGGVMDGAEDIFLLRQPLLPNLTFEGFKEANHAYETGTDEVRRLLLHECNLIYECNVCRNMFRSLVNFIGHKRVSCQHSSSSISSGDGINGYPNLNSALIFQSKPPNCDALMKQNGTTGIKTSASGIAQLEGAVQQKEQHNHNNNYNVPSNVKAAQLKEHPREVKATISESIKMAESVHQIFKQEKTDNIIGEEQQQPKQQVTAYDEKATENHKEKPEEIKQSEQIEQRHRVIGGAVADIAAPKAQQLSVNIWTCDICKKEFQSEKNLKIHLNKKHLSSYGLKCPSCPMTFTQPAAVVRHLSAEHKQPVCSIRLIRRGELGVINKGTAYVESVQSAYAKQGMKRELKRLQLLEIQTGKNGDSDDVINIESKRTIISTCVYCDKPFERRAALSTHLLNCRAKQDALEAKVQNPHKRIKLQTRTSAERSEYEQQPVAVAPICLALAIDDAAAAAAAPVSATVKINEAIKEEDDDSNLLNEMFANLGKQSFGPGLQTVSLDRLVMLEEPEEEEEGDSTNTTIKAKEELQHEDSSSVSVNQTLNETKSPAMKFPAAAAETDGDADASSTSSPEVKRKIGGRGGSGTLDATRRRFRITHTEKRLSCRCKICNKQFNALSNLRRHISMFHYRARRFGCTLCDYRAFRRYDIVNHLGFVHKMIGEREAMSAEYVSVHEVLYSKDDVDGDIVLMTDENEKFATTSDGGTEGGNEQKKKKEALKTYEKRARRNKTISAAACDSNHIQIDAGKSAARQNLKRSMSQQESGGGSTSKILQKRPIRNRIKPVNKDFVYDLSNLLQQQGGTGCERELVTLRSSLKRRNTVSNTAAAMAAPAPASASDISYASIDYINNSAHIEPLLNPHKDLIHIKGAAQRICLQLVHQGSAASSTQPELPSERPQMRTRLISTCRADIHSVPVIEHTELEAARMKSTLLEDTFLEKIAKRSAAVFKIKPCLALQHSALSLLLQKVDSSLHGGNLNASAIATLPHHDDDIKNNTASSDASSTHDDADALDADDISDSSPTSPPPYSLPLLQLRSSNGKYFIEPEPSIPHTSSPPPTPRKRITLMERLAENKAKSLLRSALEN